MTSSLRIYITLVAGFGLLLLASSIANLLQQPDSQLLLLRAIPWLLLVLAVSRYEIVASGSGSASTMNSTVDFCLILTFGGPLAICIGALNALYLNLVRMKRPWYKALFNVSQISISLLGSSLVYSLLKLPDAGSGPLRLAHLPGFAALAISFFVINQLLVSVAIRLETGMSLGSQLRRMHYFDQLSNAFVAFLGVTMYYMYLRTGWAGVLLMLLPMGWLVHHSRRFNLLKEVHEELDRKTRLLEEGSVELTSKNSRLEELNSSLSNQKRTLQSQAIAMENTNRALSESNRRLKETQVQLLRSEKLKAMGQMASGVAHDFNNILGAILAKVELLRLGSTEGGEVQKGLDLIYKSASDGAVLVKRIQDFTRGATQALQDPVDLADLAEDVLEMTRPLWRDKAQKIGITYDVMKHIDSGLMVLGNSTELREVLHNIINNALEAMPNGGALVLRGHRSGDRVLLSIKDTGPGMTSLVSRRIFEPYFTTKGVQGNGLGLSVSHGIIKQHGGEIEVDSQPGEGTRFQIILPAVTMESDYPLNIDHPRQTLHSIRSETPRRVLVVDDEEDVRSVLVEILKAMGHEVDQADSGRGGVEKYRRYGYDVVFTDLGMPDFNGWDVANRIWRRAVEENAGVVLILVTGWGTQISQQELHEHHIHKVLAKPFKINEVKELIDQLPDRLGSLASPLNEQDSTTLH
ncbi:MAG: response regulator [Candidatus Cloacimonetes bacterium]|nr:response regulator [Candidatus Cloacimonadota bacterium]